MTSNRPTMLNTKFSDKRVKKDFEDWDESILPAFKVFKSSTSYLICE